MKGQWTALPSGHTKDSSLSKRKGEKMKRLRWIWRGDLYLRAVILLAVIASISSFAYFYSHEMTVLYNDAKSHLMIAKRVVDSLTPGFAQLGGVWLPLPHILMLPFIWNDFMYWSGLAGSIVSMASFILATVFIYKIALLLTEDKGAGLIAAFIFAINPNVLYMQSTPMTELPLFLFMAASIYFLTRWSQTNSLIYLVATGGAVFLATITRYEGWILLLGVTVALIYICVRQRFGHQKTEGHVVYFGILAGFGIFLWFVWNQVIFDDALGFMRGEYAKPSLWVAEGELAIGNLSIATRTFWLATTHNLGPVVLAMAGLGLVYYLLRTKISADKIGPLILLMFFPFFVTALYLGQRPLHIPEITGYMYNVRFGLVMILPAAFTTCYLTNIGKGTKIAWLPKVLVISLVSFATMATFQTNNVITLNEPASEKEASEWGVRAVATAQWLSQNYDEDLILMANFGNESIAFESRIPMGKFIYEGSYKYWEPALENPQDFAKWVFMRGGITPDKVWKALHSTPQLLDNYDLVYQNGGIEIYKRKPTL